MKARLVCGRCGASSAQRRDQVSESAIDYTCSRCLCGSPVPENLRNGLPHDLSTPVPASPLEFRSSHKGFRGTSRRGGRPALSPAERRQRARDRKRRLRARNREKSRSESHVRMTDTTANRVPEHKGEHS